jgi:hypothetical protein
MGRLDVQCDQSLNGRSPGGFPCAIRARGTDGVDYIAEVLDPPGFSRRGLDASAVTDKFHAVTSARLPPAVRDRIVEAALELDRSPDLEQLIVALASANAAAAKRTAVDSRDRNG